MINDWLLVLHLQNLIRKKLDTKEKLRSKVG